MLKPKKLLILGICGLSLNINFNDEVLANSIRSDLMQTSAEVPITVPVVPVTTVSATPVTQTAISSVAEKILVTTQGKTIVKIKPKIEYMYANTYVYIKSKKSNESDKKALLTPGDKVKVIKKNEKWCKVKCNNTIGFIETTRLENNKKDAMKKAKDDAEIFWLTGYCPCLKCSEGYGRQTASGRTATANHTIAADLTELPLYTEVYIEGYGVYVVEDVGGGVKGKHIDVFFDTDSETYSITGTKKVYVIK